MFAGQKLLRQTITLFAQVRMVSSNSSGFRVALLQLTVTADKSTNVANAIKRVQQAKLNGCTLAILPECFNAPYNTALFREYSEVIPGGDTCEALSQAAKSNEMYIVGGSIPEICDDKVYNTCTVWDPNGNLIAKHRKVHLFDINIPGGVCFKESDALAAGNTLNTFQLGKFKIGLGICYDIRFAEMAAIYRKQGCDMLIYPSAFNMTTGPLHWSLLIRCRAVDNQAFVAVASPARVTDSNYVAWGHSMVVDPWGKILEEASEKDMDLYVDLDFGDREKMRQQIPTENQRRTDLYDTIDVKNKV
ncbi:omega-amidase NIT2 [Acyrthosiphon pisum]|uniref:omega-amidase n=2 Tax=Acyrthosiphon pisum TaxID=7029 RepID=A0A8R2A7B0_ACYPI|nr:omega-amidase NIT2 [Acyrthosiphon pisum]|eukprot:XP_001948752.2 PREDICTED: omega-amidase NIT2 [Acyrthosiphon pisum]